MKKLMIFVAAFTIMASTVHSQNLKEFFNNYNKDSRFESVTVGRFLLTLPLIFGNLDKSDREFIACIHRVNVLSSASVVEPAFSAIVLTDLNKIIRNGNFESLVEVNDKGEKVNVYYHINRTIISDLLVVVNEKDEMNIVLINGKLTKNMIDKYQNELANNSSNLPISLH
ncbi:MAG: DUF4252 domain-containing protein [Paludibacter sp.]|nr:DUF4252 domain-containing protein [Paludibacter sp.]